MNRKDLDDAVTTIVRRHFRSLSDLGGHPDAAFLDEIAGVAEAYAEEEVQIAALNGEVKMTVHHSVPLAEGGGAPDFMTSLMKEILDMPKEQRDAIRIRAAMRRIADQKEPPAPAPEPPTADVRTCTQYVRQYLLLPIERLAFGESLKLAKQKQMTRMPPSMVLMLLDIISTLAHDSAHGHCGALECDYEDDEQRPASSDFMRALMEMEEVKQMPPDGQIFKRRPKGES